MSCPCAEIIFPYTTTRSSFCTSYHEIGKSDKSFSKRDMSLWPRGTQQVHSENVQKSFRRKKSSLYIHSILSGLLLR